MTTGWRIVFAAILLGLVALAGCAGGPRAFVADRSVYFTSPAPLTTVTLPFTASWQAPHRAGVEYALFVDSPPLSPGSSLRELAGASCRRLPSCHPSVSYLNSIGVYPTASDQMTLSTLPQVAGIEGHEKDPIHTLTLVLMNSSGTRVSTGAWQVQFRA